MDDVDLIRRTLALLRRRRLGLQVEIEKITTAISALEDIEQAADVLAAMPRNTRPRVDASLMGLSIPDAAARILLEAGRPMHFFEIIARLQERGFRTDQDREQFRVSLVSALARKARSRDTFVATAPGTYALREWESAPTPTEMLTLLMATNELTAPDDEAPDAASA